MSTMQEEFPFASLDFPGRNTLYPHEVAAALSVHVHTVYAWIESGDLQAMDIARKGGTKAVDSQGRARRQNLRIPIEAYHGFVLGSLTVPGHPYAGRMSTDQLRQAVSHMIGLLAQRGVRLRLVTTR